MNKNNRDFLEEEFSPESLADYNKRPLPAGWDKPIEGLGEPVGARPTKGRVGRQTRPFIKGPIDESWCDAAFKVAGGVGLLLGLKLWRLQGMAGGRLTKVNFSKVAPDIPQRSKWRSLEKLEAAGLIRRHHHPGKRSEVEIIFDGAPVVPGSGEVKVQEP